MSIKASELIPGAWVDLEGCEYLKSYEPDIAMAEQLYATVDNIVVNESSVLVHFTEHTSLLVPKDYVFK